MGLRELFLRHPNAYENGDWVVIPERVVFNLPSEADAAMINANLDAYYEVGTG